MKNLLGDGMLALAVYLSLIFAAIGLAHKNPTTIGAVLVVATTLYLLAQVPYRQIVGDLANHFKS